MKNQNASSVSARVRRWFGLLNVVLFGGLMMGVAMNSPATSTTLVAKCIPSNDDFVGPLTPFVSKIIGAVGGLIPILIASLIIVMIVMGLWKAFRNEDLSSIFKAIVAVAAVPVVGIAVLIIINGFYVLLNGLCASSPF